MPGGLINIASYGAEDLFLTGTPEISYFKLVYRRHTNFATESIKLKFDDYCDFNKKARLTFPKSGDLIHKSYLEIITPEINFSRNLDTNSINSLQVLYNTYISDYATVKSYMNINIEAYREAIINYSCENMTVSDMIAAINMVFATNNSSSGSSSGSSINIISDFMTLLENTELSNNSPIINKYILCKFFYNNIGLDYIAQNFVPDNTQTAIYNKNVFKSQIDYAKQISNYVVEYFQWLINSTYDLLLDAQNTNYKLAWVKRLGHSIIEYVSIYIGGEVIDKHYGEWIDIWYEISSNKELDPAYLKMIGNIPELINFDRTTKPRTNIYIPMIFWFNKYNGQALPLIAMQYHDIQLELKLRKFSEVAYIENIGTFNLDNMYEDANLQIEVNLLTDYVYLDTIERQKFAKSSHEYLIDVIQNQFEDNSVQELRTRLEFTNTCKEIIWVVQRESLLTNPTGTVECQWSNYSSNSNLIISQSNYNSSISQSSSICCSVFNNNNNNINNNININSPFIDCQITVNGSDLLNKQEFGFFNYVVPYNCHTRIPNVGINLFSFSISPEENQPSGSCNLSRLSIVQLILNLNNNMLFELDSNNKNTDMPENLKFKIFGVSQNILRIIGGMAALAFT